MNWWWVHETMHNEKRRFSSSFPWQTSRSSHSCCWFARLSDSIASVGFALALACRARSNRIESNETETIDYRLTNIHSPVDVSCLTTEKKNPARFQDNGPGTCFESHRRQRHRRWAQTVRQVQTMSFRSCPCTEKCICVSVRTISILPYLMMASLDEMEK